MAAPLTGIKLPARKGRAGFFSPVAGKDAIRQNIMTILTTRPGERVHMPEFGARLWELVFEPNDVAVDALVQQFVFDAIERWEPRVQPVEVRVTRDEAANEIVFSLTYVIRNSPNQTEQVILPARREVGFL